MGLYVNWLKFETILKWPKEELQFFPHRVWPNFNLNSVKVAENKAVKGSLTSHRALPLTWEILISSQTAVLFIWLNLLKSETSSATVYFGDNMQIHGQNIGMHFGVKKDLRAEEEK